ncbi:sugar phosphate isomerase/epimerase family protein [Anaerosphaera multitolerans]|uniref:Sugar phosphate isomerase/epimerase n=1 Tax=Anaerosphaera multitolerans TaxID=2487351 RepID=A0A437S8N9_9FIRM|nr:TIM barrel protein [Anaerosphaera multitolerans]RVU55208.1 sugar phosphate isomerase/epimerase [Anaerosphaera multitolerans]
MDFEFSLAQLTVLNSSPIEIAKIAHNCGYNYVSLRQIYMGLNNEIRYDLKKDKKMKNELRSYLKNTGLKVLDIELARIFDGVEIKEYEDAMETAVDVGAKHILSSIWTENKGYYIEKFNELCELASQYNLTVDLEYVPIAGVKNLDDTLEVIKNTDFDNAGIMIDTHHVHRAKDNPKRLMEIPEKYFNFAHICDASKLIPKEKDEMTRILREERLYLGEGGIDIKDILNNMPIVPYSIELPNLKKVSLVGYEEHAKQCLISAKNYCEKYVHGRYSYPKEA